VWYSVKKAEGLYLYLTVHSGTTLSFTVASGVQTVRWIRFVNQ